MGIKIAVTRLYQHSKNKMILAGRGKLRKRYILKLKFRRLDGLDVISKM